MHFIAEMYFGRFATRSQTFRSTVVSHQFGKIKKIVILNLNAKLGASQNNRWFLTFCTRPRTSQIRDYNETENVLRQIDFLMKRNDL